ncbi:MAG: hypothetical protein RLN59_02365 [Haliea sp.]
MTEFNFIAMGLEKIKVVFQIPVGVAIPMDYARWLNALEHYGSSRLFSGIADVRYSIDCFRRSNNTVSRRVMVKVYGASESPERVTACDPENQG